MTLLAACLVKEGPAYNLVAQWGNYGTLCYLARWKRQLMITLWEQPPGGRPDALPGTWKICFWSVDSLEVLATWMALWWRGVAALLRRRRRRRRMKRTWTWVSLIQGSGYMTEGAAYMTQAPACLVKEGPAYSLVAQWGNYGTLCYLAKWKNQLTMTLWELPSGGPPDALPGTWKICFWSGDSLEVLVTWVALWWRGAAA